MSSEDSQHYLRINTALLGRDVDLTLAESFLIQQKGAVRYRDAFYLRYPEGEAWFFEYGVLVCWNVAESDRQQLCHELAKIIRDLSDQQLSEQYHYFIDPAQPFRIHHDVITLSEDESMIRLALSHGFAQSAKLDFFEEKAKGVIQQNTYLSKQLAATGKIRLSRRELAQLRGVLFDTSSDITLHFNLLDTPEFFWDYPELESYYLALAKYLDLAPRIELLNHKLATIHELLDMLAEEQRHKHSAFLEWVIIVLIAVDILIYFLPK